MLDKILDNKNLAILNMNWAVFHIPIAMEIDPEFPVVIPFVFLAATIAAYVMDDSITEKIMLAIGVIYLAVLPPVIEVLMDPSSMETGSAEFNLLGSIAWVVIIPLTLLVATKKWTGIGMADVE